MVVHFEVAQLVWKMSHRVCAIDDRDDATPPRDQSQIPHRKELSGLVGDVAEMEHLGLRGDRGLESMQQVGLCGGAWKIDTRDIDFVAPGTLVPSRQHPRVVLFGCDDFVARLQVDAHLGNLK